MNQAFICDGVRTPIGRYGGALAQVRADDLVAPALRVLLERHPQVDWAQLDDVILGCANQAGEDNRNLARMALLLAGVPVGVSGTTVNRLCGSGLDALAMAARSIKAGDAGLLLAGGAESMTRAPLVMGKADSAFSRQAQLYDTTSAGASSIRGCRPSSAPIRCRRPPKTSRHSSTSAVPIRRLCAAQPAARRSGAGVGPPGAGDSPGQPHRQKAR